MVDTIENGFSGHKNGMEDWSVPLFSNLTPDEFQSISFDVSFMLFSIDNYVILNQLYHITYFA